MRSRPIGPGDRSQICAARTFCSGDGTTCDLPAETSSGNCALPVPGTLLGGIPAGLHSLVRARLRALSSGRRENGRALPRVRNPPPRLFSPCRYLCVCSVLPFRLKDRLSHAPSFLSDLSGPATQALIAGLAAISAQMDSLPEKANSDVSFPGTFFLPSRRGPRERSRRRCASPTNSGRRKLTQPRGSAGRRRPVRLDFSPEPDLQASVALPQCEQLLPE